MGFRTRTRHSSAFVVQHVISSFHIEDCDGNDVTLTLLMKEFKFIGSIVGKKSGKTFEFWEAFPINGNSAGDDLWRGADWTKHGICTRGYNQVEGYLKVVLGPVPSSFIMDNPKLPAPGVASTDTNPLLKSNFPSRRRFLFASWDCCPC